MNLNQLQYFYAVAREGGFTKASQALRIQQPAISRMVHSLEERLELKLFEKIGREVRLTSAGQEVFEHCKSIFGEVEKLKVQLGQISGRPKGPLFLAAAEPIASTLLPKTLKSYLREHPQVHPQIFSGPASLLLQKIVAGELELGLFFHTPELPPQVELVREHPVRFYLVVKKELRRDKTVLKKFIGSREIDDRSNKEFPTLKRLQRDIPEAKISISSNNLVAHRQMVLEGLGVSILPDFLVCTDIGKTLVDIYPQERFMFPLRILKRKNAALSLNAKTLLKFL